MNKENIRILGLNIIHICIDLGVTTYDMKAEGDNKRINYTPVNNGGNYEMGTLLNYLSKIESKANVKFTKVDLVTGELKYKKVK